MSWLFLGGAYPNLRCVRICRWQGFQSQGKKPRTSRPTFLHGECVSRVLMGSLCISHSESFLSLWRSMPLDSSGVFMTSSPLSKALSTCFGLMRTWTNEKSESQHPDTFLGNLKPSRSTVLWMVAVCSLTHCVLKRIFL